MPRQKATLYVFLVGKKVRRLLAKFDVANWIMLAWTWYQCTRRNVTVFTTTENNDFLRPMLAASQLFRFISSLFNQTDKEATENKGPVS